MKQYKALQDLPFNIKKDDILTEVKKGVYHNSKGEVIPMNVNKEKSFFKEIILPFEKDSLVVLKTQNTLREYRNPLFSGNTFKIPAKTPVKFVDVFERNKNTICIIEFNHTKYEVSASQLLKYEIYYFINSSGIVHQEVFGRDEKVDFFRKKSNNYFIKKEDATEALNLILQS